MSYLVLARKWRPQSFEDLIGQEHVGRTLGNAIHSGRVHHAFLFTGARGVGKTSAARILAKALNCEEGLTATPCNVCQSCKEITAGQGIDVFEIDGASNTGVDDIRDLRDNIRYLPSRSRYKIFIIDEVHMLSINAFNALLKTLEEPPSHAKFIFATTEPHKIPLTIHSRVQRFDFRKIPLPRVVARLRQIVDAENIAMSDRALALVARRGEGSMRDSLSTLDQVIAFCGESVADEDVLGLLGMVDRRLLFDVVEGVMQREPARVLDGLRRIDELGHSFRQFCQELVDAFRSLVLLKVVGDAEGLIDAPEGELRDLRKLSDAAGLEDCQRSLTVLMKAETELAGSSFPRLTLEMALVRLAHLPAARDVASLVRKIESLERRLASSGGVAPPLPSPSRRSVAERPPEPPEKKAEAPAPLPEGEKGLPGLVEFVKGCRRPGIASILEQAALLGMELPLIHLGLPKGSFSLSQFEDNETLADVTRMATEYFGCEIRFRISPVEGAAAPKSLVEERQAQETDRKKRLREDALQHPMVQAAQKIFSAEVKEVRPIDKGFV